MVFIDNNAPLLLRHHVKVIKLHYRATNACIKKPPSRMAFIFTNCLILLFSHSLREDAQLFIRYTYLVDSNYESCSTHIGAGVHQQ